MEPGIIILLFAVIVLVYLIVVYNGLVKKRVRCEEGWSDIDVQLKRRYDLIPNLVESVKGYAKHEQDVLENVTKARNAAMGNHGTPAEHAVSENQLKDALKSLFAVAESYPDLKANQNFLDLQSQLADTEDKIQASRRFFNGTVKDFNTAVQVFPTSIIASIFGFQKKEFFEIGDAAERENVKVSF
ncbi:MAG: LemA family protein, LemA protein [Candidatus Peregrinibacteria bacterium GW2011_GWF2_43_17]|nr:MAG: LemA family protein, LemA protein [Candidatus Peregrinibacteria bacterium GW2011_GWF2_43_17]KKT20664.1 MAG: LemA-like protein [Candidatus Peregrinibacteria bacterium GW2011_GWA2_43_8]HAU39352.1 hypothetical protein [Candidatus Peregrinibacteria bacterium]